MSEDIRKQLIEALDEGEKLARECTQGEWQAAIERGKVPVIGVRGPTPGTGVAIAIFGGHGSMSGKHSRSAADARHAVRWDPSSVLRLIERDRKLLALHRRVIDSGDSGLYTNWEMAQVDLIDEVLVEVAAFWLGTPEAES